MFAVLLNTVIASYPNQPLLLNYQPEQFVSTVEEHLELHYGSSALVESCSLSAAKVRALSANVGGHGQKSLLIVTRLMSANCVLVSSSKS